MRSAGKQAGHSLIEMLAVVAIAGMLAAVTAPSMSGILQRARLRGAAREIAGLFREARSHAISRGGTLAYVFEHDAQSWKYTLYADGDGDGVRAGDIASGQDPPLGPPRRIKERWEGVDFGFLGIPRIHKLPPTSGWMTATDDPIQFGSTDIISFTPLGDASSGSLYLTDSRSEMAAITLYGPTVRIRIYRYDVPQEEWDI
jgi:prepilin-type N-terminal cleavage/methylation domain-containing protein